MSRLLAPVNLFSAEPVSNFGITVEFPVDVKFVNDKTSLFIIFPRLCHHGVKQPAPSQDLRWKLIADGEVCPPEFLSSRLDGHFHFRIDHFCHNRTTFLPGCLDLSDPVHSGETDGFDLTLVHL